MVVCLGRQLLAFSQAISFREEVKSLNLSRMLTSDVKTEMRDVEKRYLQPVNPS
jgi:hypothetical protein